MPRNVAHADRPHTATAPRASRDGTPKRGPVAGVGPTDRLLGLESRSGETLPRLLMSGAS